MVEKVEFNLPNYTVGECSDGHKDGSIKLKEFSVRWEYNGDGKILVSLMDDSGKFIQSIEHVKSKI
jgi:hypothetical protein